jgi:hypothetical protein
MVRRLARGVSALFPQRLRAAVSSFRYKWVVLLVFSVLLLNAIYQVVRKPAELFFPVSGVLAKTPRETWQAYGSLFEEHSTAVITPQLLAALAQVEGSGDPLARTPWRLQIAADPREVYRPASSAVGMYQITEATFQEAKRYCIRDHAVLEDGCWFNGLYMRVIPSHAVELTSAWLDRRVAGVLQRAGARASPAQKQDLAALIHLCGPSAGEAYARRGFRLAARQRCGTHDAAAYLARVNDMKRLFARLSALR